MRIKKERKKKEQKHKARLAQIEDPDERDKIEQAFQEELTKEQRELDEWAQDQQNKLKIAGGEHKIPRQYLTIE